MSVVYKPAFAPFVTGEHDPRRSDPETGLVVPMRFTASCSKCGEKVEGVCDSGRVREKIDKWAILHLHRDVLGTAIPSPRT